jgi:DNA-binding MarR family transcriptional regulator
MQQFRAMRIIERSDGASLSQVSERLGATISAASKLIDGLVERGYVRRETAEDDRRRLILALSGKGKESLASVHMEMISCLAEKLDALSPSECALLRLSMDLLRTTLAPSTAPADQ